MNNHKLDSRSWPDARETENTMTKLEHLYGHFGQSPWLDNLTRAYSA